MAAILHPGFDLIVPVGLPGEICFQTLGDLVSNGEHAIGPMLEKTDIRLVRDPPRVVVPVVGLAVIIHILETDKAHFGFHRSAGMPFPPVGREGKSALESIKEGEFLLDNSDPPSLDEIAGIDGVKELVAHHMVPGGCDLPRQACIRTELIQHILIPLVVVTLTSLHCSQKCKVQFGAFHGENRQLGLIIELVAFRMGQHVGMVLVPLLPVFGHAVQFWEGCGAAGQGVGGIIHIGPELRRPVLVCRDDGIIGHMVPARDPIPRFVVQGDKITEFF